mmetsp:Transcript_14592/g.35387  ORF Transcript_14592/g.35387 Transcript_14592/m.35387 type:complete len:225 (+) Transcript_14592:146-820(+)
MPVSRPASAAVLGPVASTTPLSSSDVRQLAERCCLRSVQTSPSGVCETGNYELGPTQCLLVGARKHPSRQRESDSRSECKRCSKRRTSWGTHRTTRLNWQDGVAVFRTPNCPGDGGSAGFCVDSQGVERWAEAFPCVHTAGSFADHFRSTTRCSSSDFQSGCQDRKCGDSEGWQGSHRNVNCARGSDARGTRSRWPPRRFRPVGHWSGGSQRAAAARIVRLDYP